MATKKKHSQGDTTKRTSKRAKKRRSKGDDSASDGKKAKVSTPPDVAPAKPADSVPSPASGERPASGESDEITLDGRAPSTHEIDVAKQSVDFLRGVATRLADDADAAQVLYDVGALLADPLGNDDDALSAMRDSFQRNPTAIHLARGYRRAAARASSWGDAVPALEGEARATKHPTHRAALEVERGAMLEKTASAGAARAAYVSALEHDASNVSALQALERLSLYEADYAAAAEWAQRLSEAITDASWRGEHGARAARHLETAGETYAALAHATNAQVHAPTSPSVHFVLERLCAAQGSYAELISLRETQIDADMMTPEDGFFDVGIMARYRLGDRAMAIRAFTDAAQSTDETMSNACLRELSSLLEKEQRWEELIKVEQRRVKQSQDATEKAALLTRIAGVREDKLEDRDGAVEAYEAAHKENPKHVPALEGAGRLYYRMGAQERLLQMHRLEAQAAATPAERAAAMLRAGELLIKSIATIDDGIVTLRGALAEMPDNLSAFGAMERALIRKEDWEGLVDLYEQELARVEEPTRRRWLLNQVGVIASDRLGDRKRAIEALRRASQIDAVGPPSELVTLVRLLEEEDDHDQLVAALSQLAEATPDSTQKASLLERIAAAHERAGNDNDAVEAYVKAIAMAPPSHPVYASAGRAFLRAGHHAELLAVFEAGSRSGTPDERAMWLQKAAGLLALQLGSPDDAIRTLYEAIEVAPGLPGPRRKLASLLTDQERWAELAQVLDADSDDPQVILRRGFFAEAAGDDVAAAQMYKAALDAGHEAARLPYLRLTVHHGDWQGARDYYAQGDGSKSAQAHGHYRAAEISGTRLQDADGVVDHLGKSLETETETLGSMLALLPFTEDEPEKQAQLLEALEATTTDRGTVVDLLIRRALVLDALDARDGALTVRRKLLTMQPLHPIVSVTVSLELERRGDRVALAELYRRMAGDPKIDAGLAASLQLALGAVLEQLGQPRDAADAFEAANSVFGNNSRAAALALLRLYGKVDDQARVASTLSSLAESIPAGPERAACQRQLSHHLYAAGDARSAAEQLEQALVAHPLDYEALRELESLYDARGERERIADHLLRAFEAEVRPDALIAVGNTLATMLVKGGRVEPARETVDRVLETAPGNLRALMLRAEIEEQRSNWDVAVEALDAVASNEEPPVWVRREALRRLANIQAIALSDVDGARATAKRVDELSQDVASLRVRLEIEDLIGDHESAAGTLSSLVEREDVEEGARTEMLLQLAGVQESNLDDPASAIETLGRVTAPELRPQAVSRLLELGEKTGRWDLASNALEATLDSGGHMEPEWEVAVRKRLADLLHGPLERKDAAIRHYERVVQLDPDDVGTLDLLAEAYGDADPERAIDYHRMLLHAQPGRVESYRGLRKLFLAVKDNDAAFCAEAVLEGLGVADEEEAYFYRQRRTRLPRELKGKLSDEDLIGLCPERNHLHVGLLAAIQDALPWVFPIDFAGYGLDHERVEDSASLSPVLEEMKRLFGVTLYRMCIVAPKLGPTVEPSTPALLMLPRTLEDALRREQQFVIGALFGRIAFYGAATDPRRLNAMSARHLEYMLGAACEIALTDHKDGHSGEAIFEDIKGRLDEGLSSKMKQRLTDVAQKVVDDGTPFDGAHLQRALSLAAARSGILTSGDPAVAIEAMRTYKPMFTSNPEDGPHGIAKAVMDAIPYAVSAEHLVIRKRITPEESK